MAARLRATALPVGPGADPVPGAAARRVREQLAADIDAARAAWVPADARQQAELPVEAHGAVRVMLERVGPVLVARLRAVEMVGEALAGRRWVPRL